MSNDLHSKCEPPIGAGNASGDREAFPEPLFPELIGCQQEFLRALIRTIGVPLSDVDDVLQEANLYLVANQTKFQPGTNFRAWAAQVVRLRCLNYFRNQKRLPMVNLTEQVLDSITDDVVERFDELHARLHRLDACLAKLPQEHRQLLSAVYRDGLSQEKLAQNTNRSHAAIRKTISRIRESLRKCIESGTEDI